MAFAGSTVHIGCAFSIVEILAVLYRDHLSYPENRADHPLRDYLVLSKGHGVMAQYACLREKGWIERAELENYFGNGTRLRGLAEADIPGIEVTAGSLGHGLSVGVGLALAAKRKDGPQMCYAIVGDGEANEGTIWEALMFAAQFGLDNLIVIFDKNDFQAMGPTADIINPFDLAGKLRAFHFETMVVDGHDETELGTAIALLKSAKNGLPKAIIAQTVKGKGVSFMEGKNIWHYTRLTHETYAAATQEVTAPLK